MWAKMLEKKKLVGPGIRRNLIIGLCFVVVGFLANGSWAEVQAGHGWPASAGLHVANLHYWSNGHGANDEDACYLSGTGSMSDATLKSYLEQALWASGSWDGTGNWNLDIWTTTQNCSNTDPTTVELYYDVTDAGTCGGYSCQYAWDYPVYQNGQVKHYGQSKVRFKYSHISDGASSMRSTINHESGHMFGLKDPPSGGPCDVEGWWFGSSVMHQYGVYGCPSGYIQYPTTYDKDTIVNGIMPTH